MLKKFALAGAIALALTAVAIAAPTIKVPSHLDSAGNLQESLGVACLDPTTGDAVNCGTGGGGGGAVTQSGTWTVQPGNTANTTAWKVDGSAVTQPANITQIGGASIATGHGTASGSQRVELPTDGTGVVGLNAGTAIVGKVGIDQTTDGTTNKVAATQATASNLKVEPAGNVASGATDSGNPLKIGGKLNTTLPTFTDGQRGDLQIGTRGALAISLYTPNGATGAVVTAVADGQAAQSALSVFNENQVFNGTTWDRQFTCASQTSATVTAAATTQLVALSGATNIRVCSYQVGIATTGTFKFVSGTGSNCGTGTADLTPATTLTAGNVVAVSAGNNSIFRAGASNALCLAAVTGNVQVFVSYAQF